MDLQFDLPKNQSSVIKVIGVGGGGSNAVNHMFHQGIKGVDFMVCNTDAQALQASPVPNKVQLGLGITEGLGAGANPEVGEQAARESLSDIVSILEKNTRMVFITAGMGGGTGTGAAPIIAGAARSLGILTVGIVTSPFAFEGSIRMRQAQDGIDRLREQVDSLIVINNNKLREIYGNLGFKAGFAKADEVLATAARGIAEVITHHFTTNIDLKDVRTVLADSGTAVMGSAQATGEDRAARVIRDALDSPLLNDNLIVGARNVLLLIVSGTSEITFDEIGEISEHIQNQSGSDANIILGIGEDESLGEAIGVTIIATGFPVDRQLNTLRRAEPARIVIPLEGEPAPAPAALNPQPSAVRNSSAEEPRGSAAQPDLAPLNDPSSEVLAVSEPLRIFALEEEPETLQSTDFAAINSAPAPSPEAFREVPIEAVQDVHTEAMLAQEPSSEIGTVAEAPMTHSVEATVEQPVSFTFTIRDFGQDEATGFEQEADDFETAETADSVGDETASEPRLDGFEQPLAEAAVEEREETLFELPASEVSAPEEASQRRVYELEDLLAFEEQMGLRKPAPAGSETTTATVSDPELGFELRQRPVEAKADEPVAIGAQPDTAEEAPFAAFDRPIAQSLHHKIEERKARLQHYNYRFTKSKTQDLFGSEVPAYQRLGIQLDNEPVSKTPVLGQLGVSGEEGKGELRSNNRFLHDNVD
ncbi:cell division protein FtsZ [bacterium]|nr:cell division protein FtsZ [bacterium]